MNDMRIRDTAGNNNSQADVPRQDERGMGFTTHMNSRDGVCLNGGSTGGYERL